MKALTFLAIFCSLFAQAQYKDYRITSRGDTINIIDQKDLRQGKWVIKMPGLRGEPGYDEEGIFKNGKKEGLWRVYTAMGDLFAIENYRWGNKDGKSQYFNIAGLVREESWKAVNPLNPYDTVEVPDPLDPFKVQMVVVKIEGSAVKHGTWKYFESGSGMLQRSETYFLDKLEDPNRKLVTGAIASDTTAKTAKAPAKTKPQAVLDFEKKNSGKKKIKVIDGRTGH